MNYSNLTNTLTNVSVSIFKELKNTTENGYQRNETLNINFENSTYGGSNFTNTSYASSGNYSENAGDSAYYIKATTIMFYVVIMCLGVIGNVMVALVILKSKDMRSSTNIFLLNLSIADLMVLVVRTPVALVEINSDSDAWVLGKEMCITERFVRMTVTHASVFTILALSFERYYAICQPFKAAYVCTNTRAVVICALVWFFAALTTSPLFGIITFTYKHNQDGTDVGVCTTYTRPFWNKLFFILTITVIFFIPLGILIVVYSIIVKNLKENSVFKTQNSNTSRNASNVQQRKQVTIMLGAVVLSFFVCLLPIEALALSLIVSPIETIMFLSVDGLHKVLFFAKIMLFLHSAINPILYNLMSSKFRKGFVKLLGIDKLRCKKSSITENAKSQGTSNSTVSIELDNIKNQTDS